MDHEATLLGRRAVVRAGLRAAALGLLLAVALEAPLAAAVPITGDRAAWREIGAAFRKLEASTYRMTTTAPGQTVLAEHAPPDARRTITTITGQAGEVESVAVGGETRFRVIRSGAPGTWVCGNEGPQPPAVLTMEGLGMAVEVARRPDVFIVGARARAYLLTYTFRGRPQGHRTTLYVDRKTGLPRRSITPYAPAGEVVSNYYDYGAPIAIALPPCG